MDYILNRNPKLIIEVNERDRARPALQNGLINTYSRALRKIKVKGGRQ
jgi:hypothetical protein